MWSRCQPLGGEFQHHELSSLETDLRTYFLLFCNHTPELAAEYMQFVGDRRYDDNIVLSILKFRGSLAQAAPAELGELTARALIPIPPLEDSDEYDRREGPFSYIDH